jgi:hypothetical protein
MGSEPISRAAGLGAALVLVVVVAAAGIRHGVDTTVLRPVHRVAASLEVPVVLWVAWLAFRSRRFVLAALVALALTVVLTVIGIVGGQNPPPGIALANLVGGLTLVAVFAWIAGSTNRGDRYLTPIFFFIGVQVVLGAWISISGSLGVLPLHGVLAIAVAASIGWTALARVRGGAGKLLFAAALAAPLAGMTSLQYEYSALAALAHAAAAALLVCTAAFAGARGA